MDNEVFHGPVSIRSDFTTWLSQVCNTRERSHYDMHLLIEGRLQPGSGGTGLPGDTNLERLRDGVTGPS